MAQISDMDSGSATLDIVQNSQGGVKMIDSDTEVQMTAAHAKGATPSKNQSVSYEQNLANLLHLEMSFSTPSSHKQVLVCIRRTLEGALPQLREKIPRGSKGVASFFEAGDDYHGPLALEDCELMLRELKSKFASFPDIDAEIVKRAHALMVNDGTLYQLSPRSLPFYLHTLSGLVKPGDSDEHLRTCLTQTMEIVQILEKYHIPPMSKETSSAIPADKSAETLAALRQVLEGYIKFMQEGRVKIRESFGSVEHYASLEEYMTKVSETTDVTARQIKWKQGMALLAEMLGSQLEDPVVETLESLIENINNILG